MSNKFAVGQVVINVGPGLYYTKGAEYTVLEVDPTHPIIKVDGPGSPQAWVTAARFEAKAVVPTFPLAVGDYVTCVRPHYPLVAGKTYKVEAVGVSSDGEPDPHFTVCNDKVRVEGVEGHGWFFDRFNKLEVHENFRAYKQDGRIVVKCLSAKGTTLQEGKLYVIARGTTRRDVDRGVIRLYGPDAGHYSVQRFELYSGPLYAVDFALAAFAKDGRDRDDVADVFSNLLQLDPEEVRLAFDEQNPREDDGEDDIPENERAVANIIGNRVANAEVAERNCTVCSEPPQAPAPTDSLTTQFLKAILNHAIDTAGYQVPQWAFEEATRRGL
ncbi:hypothetical protein AVU43_gp10 [Ralstonia phage RSJ5]|uniref:Uncharacterized protein n=1 Tax=Ralstonia phage RSJ5 TaxID=1538364 RepID=A0A077KYI6_9CAUD|nr:hypothetical protein AVU43_gp10 [Ralstonia phage RSJ5]BAP34904.1 hypothetical protein [Ralstonia phage RSJ5]